MRRIYLAGLLGVGGCAQLDSFQGFVSHAWNQVEKTSEQAPDAPAATSTGISLEKIGAQEVPEARPLPVTDEKLPPLAPWKMVQGQTFSRELTAWGNRAGWTVVWSLDHDWVVPAATQFNGSFQEAATSAINTLLLNGVLLRATFFAANKTLLVSHAGTISSQE